MHILFRSPNSDIYPNCKRSSLKQIDFRFDPHILVTDSTFHTLLDAMIEHLEKTCIRTVVK